MCHLWFNNLNIENMGIESDREREREGDKWKVIESKSDEWKVIERESDEWKVIENDNISTSVMYGK